MEITVDLYKQLDLDRSWDEKTIRDELKSKQKLWTKRQGACNDKKQLMDIEKVIKYIEDAYRYLTKDSKREKYDKELDKAYADGKIVDNKEEELKTVLEQAMEYYNKGNIAMATKCAEEAVEGKINDAYAYGFLAQCYADSNEYGKALVAVDKGLEIFTDNVNLCWYGARVASFYTKDFEDAQKRINRLIELTPNGSVGYAEQVFLHMNKGDKDLAYNEIDSYISAHPDDTVFKEKIAYGLISYTNEFYLFSEEHENGLIASKDDYKKCLDMTQKAYDIYADEYTASKLERAKYFGQKEWNDWNNESILSLFGCGVLFSIVYLPFGLIFIAIGALLCFFSFRPYWQINYTYVTGKMGQAESIIHAVGNLAASLARGIVKLVIKFYMFIFTFIIGWFFGAIINAIFGNKE